jgi:hypothetical protein
MQNPHDAAPSPQTEAFFSRLVGKFVIVHTLVDGHEASARVGAPQAGTLYGRLESNYPDALVLEIVERNQPSRGRILVYKRAIVAIETHT